MVWRQGELFQTQVCELCRRQTDLRYVRSCDQYLCEDCEINPEEETGEDTSD